MVRYPHPGYDLASLLAEILQCVSSRPVAGAFAIDKWIPNFQLQLCC